MICEEETPLSTKLKAQSTEEGGGLFDDLAESGATSDNPQMCQESTQNGFYNPMCRSLSPFPREPSMWGHLPLMGVCFPAKTLRGFVSSIPCLFSDFTEHELRQVLRS